MLATLISPKNFTQWATLGGVAKNSSLQLASPEPKARKNADNPLIWGSGSFKVTDFGTNRKLVVDFLQVIIQDFSLALTAQRKYVELGLC